ncbi:MAG: hypothetical protein NVS1B10_02340 [Candidatus Saccharimonadales bacterium]
MPDKKSAAPNVSDNSEEAEHIINVRTSKPVKPKESSTNTEQTAPLLPKKVSDQVDQASAKQDYAPEPVKPKIEKPKVESPPVIPQEKTSEMHEQSEDTEPDVPFPEEKSLAKDAYNDGATNKAVDDIIASESDQLLDNEDSKFAPVPLKSTTSGSSSRFKRLLKFKWLVLSLAILLLVIFGVPYSRYKVLGLVIKKSATVIVTDSKTGMPVSSADISIGNAAAKTDAYGRVHLNAAVGQHQLIITKKYYAKYMSAYFVGFKAAMPASVKLQATGRLVPVIVNNKITGQPISGVQIHVLDTTAKTNNQGQATIALPTSSATDKANLTLNGYNSADVEVSVTDSVDKANTFNLTPSGQIYFLSNRSGNIDVVKTNLDGTGRTTVMEGTGHEDSKTTSLLASRDWHYAVLKSKRDNSQAALYLIDTSNDKVTQFDNLNADFNLIGWYGHSFIYEQSRTNQPIWQPGRQVLKSYDAENLQLNQLDQSQAEGNAKSYAYQSLFNYYILNGVVVYNTQWYGYNANGTFYDVSAKNDTIRSIQPTGQNKKDNQTFTSGSSNIIQAVLYEPQAVYYSIETSADKKTSYYAYENQSVTPATIDSNSFTKPYPTFLLSPSGNQTFWTELRDGKNSLFTGDSNSKNKKQVASLNDYSPYGWYSDNYLLISKSSSQLYIIPTSGLSGNQTPFKVTDYYKPAQTYNGYGYGYGGL